MITPPITNSTPRAVMLGINDQSVLPAVTATEATAIHTPLVYIMAPTGPDVFLAMSGSEFIRAFGSAAVDMRGDYYNHATAFALSMLDLANPVYCKRVYDSTAQQAQSTLCAAIYGGASTNAYPVTSLVAGKSYTIVSLGNTTISQWHTMGLSTSITTTSGITLNSTTFVATSTTQSSGTVVPTLYPLVRDGSGVPVLDSNGNYTYNATTPITNGITLELSWQELRSTTDSALDAGPVNVNGITYYPLITFRDSFVGVNNNGVSGSYDSIGVRLWSSNSTSINPADLDVITDQSALQYSLQIVQNVPNSSPTIIPTLDNAPIVSFMLQPNSYNYKTNQPLSLETADQLYSDDGSTTGLSPTFSPITAPLVHYNNIEAVLTTLQTQELAARSGISSPINAGNFELQTAYIIKSLGTSVVGSITNNVMTVTAVNSGSLDAGDILSGTNVPANTAVISQLTGTTGGIGTYLVSTTTPIAATAMLSGTSYTIVTLGSTLTNWSAIGDTASTPEIGDVFTFNNTTPTGNGTVIKSVTQTIASTTLTNLTDFTLIGAPSNTVGTTFVASGTGANNGSGTLIPYSENTSNSLSIYMIDPFTGTDYYGTPYYGFVVDTSNVQINKNRTYYLTGGVDGALDNATYEQCVYNECTLSSHYQNPSAPLIDSARYPFSAIYDSGYSLPGSGQITCAKYALANWLDYRPDVHVTLGTYSVPTSGAGKALSLSDEISIGTMLRNQLFNHVESAYWGTPAVRACIMMQQGTLLNGRFNGLVSTVFELASKRAAYSGATQGVLNSDNKYSVAPGNIVTYMKDISNSFIPLSAKTQAWISGLNYCQSYDTKRLFYAGLHTIYNQERSVLASEKFMWICANVTAVSEGVWRQMTNDDSLTPAEFIDKANGLLIAGTSGKYDSQVTISVNTYFTAVDTANGYSWQQEVTVYGQVPKTVGMYTIITKRNTTAAAA